MWKILLYLSKKKMLFFVILFHLPSYRTNPSKLHVFAPCFRAEIYLSISYLTLLSECWFLLAPFLQALGVNLLLKYDSPQEQVNCNINLRAYFNTTPTNI